MTSEINTNSLTDGLVAYYPFNGNANDESGNGNNGIVYNAVLTRDRLGNPSSCYTFQGNAYIKVIDGSQFNFVDDFSLAYWINPFQGQDAYAAHFDKSHYSGSAWVVQKADGFGNSYYMGYMQSASGSWSNSNGHTYNIQTVENSWNHLAITKQGNCIKYFLNSILKTTEYTSSITISTNGNLPFFIGAVNNAVIASIAFQ